MVVQFSADAQGTSPQGRPAQGQPPAASPEQVRKKWDALLNVINNVSVDGPDAAGVDPSQRPPLRAARELVSETSGAAKASMGGGRRKEWNFRHHLMFHDRGFQVNTRSYFERRREWESYGLTYNEPMRTTWQLDTPEVPPPLGTLRGHYAKFNSSPQGSPNSRSGLLPAIGDSPGGGEVSPHSTGMSRTGMSKSDPSFHATREAGWNARHAVTFAKDNHHYHANLRAYFERPRDILW